MKILYYICFGLLISFWSCEQPPVVFTEPQPKGVHADPYVQPIYRGRFLCESDTAVLVVKGNIIYKAKPFQFRVTESEIEKSELIELQEGKLYVPEWGRQLPTRVVDDTVYFSEFVYRDTLVYLGKDHVVKSFRGHLVINRKVEDEKWDVLLLSLDEYMNLKLAIPALPEDLAKLQQVTEVEDLSTDDQVQFRLSPTLVEFDELLRTQLLFLDCDYFYRIRQPIEM